MIFLKTCEKWAEDTNPTAAPISETLISVLRSSSLAFSHLTALWYSSSVWPVWALNWRSR